MSGIWFLKLCSNIPEMRHLFVNILSINLFVSLMFEKVQFMIIISTWKLMLCFPNAVIKCISLKLSSPKEAKYKTFNDNNNNNNNKFVY